MKDTRRFKEKVRKIRRSRRTRNFLVFLVFVFIAFVFWFIMALNDSVQRNVEVKFEIENVPDSITFLSNPPSKLQITVRDKGSRLLNHLLLKDKKITIDFNEYAEKSTFRISRNMLHAIVKDLFSDNAVISSVSPDSIVVPFTDKQGKIFPVNPDYDVTVVDGMTLRGQPMVDPAFVTVFGPGVDSITAIYTEPITLRKIDKNMTVTVPLRRIQGVRIIPENVKVLFNVEQMVKRETEVPVKANYIPTGQDILFFPAKVRVSYFVPASKYNESPNELEVTASFNEAVVSSTDKVSVKITKTAPYMKMVELGVDSIQYTLVHGK